MIYKTAPVLEVVEGDPAEFVCTNTSQISTDIIWTYSNNTGDF
jgi:hypothetical protein